MNRIDNATKKLLRDPAKRRGWVIYQLAIKGLKLADVARGAGVSRQCLYQVFRHRYPRMEKVLADALGLMPTDLFAERYDADGLPIKQRGGTVMKFSCHDNKDTRPNGTRNTQTRKAA